jgi:hypothetical protein
MHLVLELLASKGCATWFWIGQGLKGRDGSNSVFAYSGRIAICSRAWHFRDMLFEALLRMFGRMMLANLQCGISFVGAGARHEMVRWFLWLVTRRSNRKSWSTMFIHYRWLFFRFYITAQ